MNPEVVQCVLCRGTLPALRDDDGVFLSHMRDQHRAYFNLDLLFSASFLDDESIKKTKDFITTLTAQSDEDRNNQNHDDSGELKIENERTPNVIVAKREEIEGKEVNKEQCYSKVSSTLKYSISSTSILKQLDSDSGPHQQLGEIKPKIKKYQRKKDEDCFVSLEESDKSTSNMKPSTVPRDSEKGKTPLFLNGRIVGYQLPLDYVPEEKEEEVIQNNQNDETQENDSDIDIDDIKEEELDSKEEDLSKYGAVMLRRKKQMERCLEVCGNKVFNSEKHKINHLNLSHNLKDTVPCPQCPKKFRNQKQLDNHIKLKHKPEITTCDICGIQNKNFYYIQQHKKSVHTSDPRTCEVCGKGCKNKFLLKAHMRMHEPNVLCPECGANLRNSKNLNDHLLALHRREDLIKHNCDVCGKGFVNKTKMKEHRVIHDEARPYPCRFEDCNFASKSAGNRSKHEKVKHGEVKTEKRTECKEESSTEDR